MSTKKSINIMTTSDSTTNNCLICTDQILDPVKIELSCGHTYCKDCLKSFFGMITKNNTFIFKCCYCTKDLTSDDLKQLDLSDIIENYLLSLQQFTNGNLQYLKLLFEMDLFSKIYTKDHYYYAIASKNIEFLEYLHAKGVQPPEQAIEAAIINADVDVIKYLYTISSPESVTIGRLQLNSHEAVQFILNEEKPFNVTKEAIECIIKYNWLDILKKLHEKGVQFQGPDGTFSLTDRKNLFIQGFVFGSSLCRDDLPIEVAAKCCNLDIIKFLHSIGKAITSEAIKLSINNLDIEAIKFYASIGYDFTGTRFGFTMPGHFNINVDMCKYLHSLGFVFDAKYFILYTDVYLEIVKYLYSIGVCFRKYILEAACKKGCLEFVKIAFLNQRFLPYKDGITLASKYGHLNIVEFLVSKKIKAKPDAIKEAAQYGHLNVVEYLTKKFKFPQKAFQEALEKAAGKGYLPIVKYLLDKRVVKHTQTAFDKAAGWGHTEVIRYFLNSKCSYSTNRAIQLAKKWNHTEVIQLLEEHANMIAKRHSIRQVIFRILANLSVTTLVLFTFFPQKLMS